MHGDCNPYYRNHSQYYRKGKKGLYRYISLLLWILIGLISILALEQRRVNQLPSHFPKKWKEQPRKQLDPFPEGLVESPGERNVCRAAEYVQTLQWPSCAYVQHSRLRFSAFPLDTSQNSGACMYSLFIALLATIYLTWSSSLLRFLSMKYSRKSSSPFKHTRTVFSSAPLALRTA